MPQPSKKKPDYSNYPSLKNMRRVLDARNPEQNMGKPGTAASVPGAKSTWQDMKDKGLTNLSEAEFTNKMNSTAFKDGPLATSSGTGKKFDLGKAVNSFATYGSNIANAFRRPPTPSVPENISPVTLKKVNLDNSRNNITRQGRISNLGYEKSGLDSNAVAALKASTLATQLEATSNVNAQEANMNAQTSNQQAQINANVDAQNTGQRNQFNNNLTEMRVAQQREQSQNIANVSDKFIAGQNEQAKAQLEMDKYRVGMQVFKESGVFDRYLKGQKLAGNTDPTGIDKQYKTKNNYSTGGILRKVFNYN